MFPEGFDDSIIRRIQWLVFGLGFLEFFKFRPDVPYSGLLTKVVNIKANVHEPARA
jgi:hypothetical protein